MMTEMDDLDDLLGAASGQGLAPSPSLMARIVADADHLQPLAGVAAPLRAKGLLATLADWFGGTVPLAGMSVAALTGIYLGVAQPTPVLALTNLVTGQTMIDSLEVLPTTSTLWAQE
ncbi:MAG: hypothetical protein H7317_15555 [Pseudorhodobacter sp.]|nr:hypothetical protein [Pseudorhodobacter sp.]